MKKAQSACICLWSSAHRDYPVYTPEAELVNGMADFASEADEAPLLALDGIPFKGSEICLNAYEVTESGVKVRIGRVGIAPGKLLVTRAPAAEDDAFSARAVKRFASPRAYSRAEFRNGNISFVFLYLLKKYVENDKEMCQLLIKEITLFIA